MTHKWIQYSCIIGIFTIERKVVYINGMTFMKNKGYIVISAVIIVIIALLSSGCASFRSSNLPSVSQWPPRYATKGKSICIIVSVERTFNGKEQEVTFRSLNFRKEQVVTLYKDSGLFSEVETGMSDTDLKAEIKIIDRNKRDIGLTILTGLTLYLMPSKGTDELIVKTTIKNKDGNTLGMYEKSEIVTSWVQLFLIFAMPFNFPGSVYEETLRDLNRSTIVELHSKGFL